MTESSTTGLAFLGVGAVSAVAAVLLFMRSRRFLEGAVSVQGLVTGISQRSDSEGGTVYSPVVQFTTVEGQSLTFTDAVGGNPPKYSEGDTVKVMYPPDKPGAARIPSWFRMWFLSSFSALFAVIFLGTGGFLYLSGSDSEAAAVAEGIPTGVPSIPPELLPSGVVPSLPPSGGSVLVVQEGSGAPSRVTVTCESVRDVKQDRDVRLRFDGGTLTFRASPFTGPGAYTPASNLEVGGSLFEDAGSSLGGAVVFDATGQAGAVNLVAGSKIASGSWDCSDVEL
jgi:hypothetical protein